MGQTKGDQSVRQTARQAALSSQKSMRVEREQREKRLSGLGVTVTVALAERDHQVSIWERQASDALRKMVEDERLTLNEAVDWCGPDLSRTEAARLRRVGQDSADETEAGAPVERPSVES
ncbi:hypothetical protein LL946_10325 [Knoellia locipacati]|uniref:hypothetical protein n=1 Tax=Knoellia locipacati TaxID=882824 RepID=UPI00384C73FD